MKKLILALLSSYVCFAYHGMQAAGLESEAVESEAVESEMVVVGQGEFGFSDNDDTAPAPLGEAVPSAQQAFEAPYVIRLGGRDFACSACGYTINRHDRCQEHIDRNHFKTREEGTCSASGCSKFFIFKKELDMHKKVHSKKPPKQCPIKGCNVCFIKPSDLRDHINSHNGVKKFVCNVCEKVFGKRSSLTSHMERHEGTPRFKCCADRCFEKFYTSTEVRKHLLRHGYSKDEARDIPLKDLKK